MLTRSDILFERNRCFIELDSICKEYNIPPKRINDLMNLINNIAETYDDVYCNTLTVAQSLEIKTNGGVIEEYSNTLANIIRKGIGAPHDLA